MTLLPPTFLHIIFLILYAAAAPLASLTIQKTTRWGEISEKYPLQSEFTGKWMNWQTVVFRFYAGVKGCVGIGLSNDYLYAKLVPRFLFPFAKPIQIPWTRVVAIKEKKVWWESYCEFVLQDAPPLTFYLSRALRKSLQNYSGNSSVVHAFGKQNDTFPDASF
jgi:hypothetical protein